MDNSESNHHIIFVENEEEMNNSDDEEKEKIDFTISDDGTAYLSSYDGEYEWTWEVIQIR